MEISEPFTHLFSCVKQYLSCSIYPMKYNTLWIYLYEILKTFTCIFNLSFSNVFQMHFLSCVIRFPQILSRLNCTFPHRSQKFEMAFIFYFPVNHVVELLSCLPFKSQGLYTLKLLFLSHFQSSLPTIEQCSLKRSQYRF